MSLDPLQDGASGSKEGGDDRQLWNEEEGFASQPRGTTEVLHWSTLQVQAWLQSNVPFTRHRMQELLLNFQNEGIDGLALLTLQQSHCACKGMSDFEWILLKGARKRLLAGNGKLHLSRHDAINMNDPLGDIFGSPPGTTRKTFSTISPRSPQPIRSNSSPVIIKSGEPSFLSSTSSLFNFPKLWWNSSTSRDEKVDSLVAEVQSLQEELVGAEEQKITLQAHIDHLDNILRSANLASYLYTRMRWTVLPGEPMIDNTDVDDWIQRFLVLQGSSIHFYIHATDFHPQGSILFSEIVEAGMMPLRRIIYNEVEEKTLYAFHFTTCHGLQLECSTPSKIQMDSWLSSVKVGHQASWTSS